MEIDRQEMERGVHPGAIAAGALLLALGGIMLFDGADWFDVPVSRLVGPFVLITLGATMITGNGGVVAGYRGRDASGPRPRLRRRGGVSGGLWLIGIGAWLLLVQTHAFGLDYHNSWPLFVIMSGLVMLMRGIR